MTYVVKIDDLVRVGLDDQKDFIVSDMRISFVPTVSKSKAGVAFSVIITNEITRSKLGLHIDIVLRCLHFYNHAKGEGGSGGGSPLPRRDQISLRIQGDERAPAMPQSKPKIHSHTR